MSEPKPIVWKGEPWSGLRGYVDRILVFEIHYNITGSRKESAYNLYNRLPGYKDVIPVDFIDSAKDRARIILVEFTKRISR